MSHSHIIETIGVKEVAEACQVRPNAVHHWKARRIPGKYWPRVAQVSGGRFSIGDLERSAFERQDLAA